MCKARFTVVIGAFVAALAAAAAVTEAAVLQHVGTIDPGQKLGRIVADPVRAKAYGITAGGDVVFLDVPTMRAEKTLSTNRKLTDIDVAPDGSFMTVLDNVTREYWNQPPSTYVVTYDLNTQAPSGIVLAQSPLFHMALGRSGRIAGVGVNQWVNVYEVDATTGQQLSTTGGGYFGSGSTDWNTLTLVSNPAGTRMYRTEIGISSIALLAFDISTDTIKPAGSRGIGSYATEPLFINSSGSSLYAGDLRVDPNDVSKVLGLFPETIYAATGDDAFAFGRNSVYDPKWGTVLEAMPVQATQMAIGNFDQYLFALDPTSNRVHVMSVVPEPGSGALGAMVAAAALIARRRSRGGCQH